MIFKFSPSKTLVALAVASSVMLTGCASSTDSVTTQQNIKTNDTIPAVVNIAADAGTQKITLEQAMADPDWMGNQPESAFWSADSSTIIYAQKEQGSVVRDLFSQSITSKTPEQVPLNKLQSVGAKKAVFSKDKTLQAYVFKGNIFVKNVKNKHDKANYTYFCN